MAFGLIPSPTVGVISLGKSAIGGRDNDLFGVWKNTEGCVVVLRAHVWIDLLKR
jgi:hypothetical protein